MRYYLILLIVIASCTSKNQSAQNECAEGNGEGCRKLGQYYEDEGELQLAQDNYELSCKFANTNGCVRLAEILQNQGNLSGAKEKLKYACDRGNTNACAKYATLLTK